MVENDGAEIKLKGIGLTEDESELTRSLKFAVLHDDLLAGTRSGCSSYRTQMNGKRVQSINKTIENNRYQQCLPPGLCTI